MFNFQYLLGFTLKTYAKYSNEYLNKINNIIVIIYIILRLIIIEK